MTGEDKIMSRLDALENPENWDFERAEERQPSRSARAVVSVAFPRDDFTIVSEAARESGKKLSEFVREAAVDRARTADHKKVVYSMSTTRSGVIRETFTRGGMLSDRIETNVKVDVTV